MSVVDRIDTRVELDWPDYRSTRLRCPTRPLVPLPERFADLDGPVFGEDALDPADDDLTAQGRGEVLGERIIVTGRLLDEDERPIENALIEIWQANAAGRYLHDRDQHPAPLDPNFTGGGRCLTDRDGRYRFTASDLAARADAAGLVPKGDLVWYQAGTRLRPYGYPHAFVPNIVHQHILVFRAE